MGVAEVSVKLVILPVLDEFGPAEEKRSVALRDEVEPGADGTTSPGQPTRSVPLEILRQGDRRRDPRHLSPCVPIW